MEVSSLFNVDENDTSRIQVPALDKVISFKDPRILLRDNWFALAFEVVIYYVLLRMFHHAKQRGVKEVFFLVSVLCGAVGLELVQQINHAGYQLWWYHLGVINLLKHQVPAYIPSFVAVVLYSTDYMTRNTKLPLMCQSLLNACLATLLMFPCLCLAPNLLFVLVHFDDPVFDDKIFNVPFCQLTYLFLFFFHSKQIFDPNYDEIESQDRHFFRFLRCSFQSGLISAVYTLVELYLLYILFVLLLHGHASFGLIFAVVVICILAKNELAATNPEGYTRSGISDTWNRKEWAYLIGYFALLALVPAVIRPENLKSFGERLELGPCAVTHAVSNTSPLDITRRRYVCPSDTEKFGFDFHCVPAPDLMTSDVKKEYTICGTPFSNPYQLVTMLILYGISCLTIFHLMFSFTLMKNEEFEGSKDEKKVD